MESGQGAREFFAKLLMKLLGLDELPVLDRVHRALHSCLRTVTRRIFSDYPSAEVKRRTAFAGVRQILRDKPGCKKNEPASSPTNMLMLWHHPGFEPYCLNPYTLQNIYNIYRCDYGPIRRRTTEEQFCHVAYRSFVSWCWGYLGRSVRVVIPCCVVTRIRQAFPDPSGQYTGFRPPLD
ncbi:unnamed protein product [Leuciscus chuanchicus]